MEPSAVLAQIPHPEYRACVLGVKFADLVRDLNAVRGQFVQLATGGQEQRLTLVASASNENQLVLRSTTGHSSLKFRADGLLLTTNYTGSYRAFDEEARANRCSYALEKLETLFGFLEEAGVSVAFFGVKITARMGGEQPVLERLRAAVSRIFRLSETLGESQRVYDFQLRASHAASDDVFSNLELTWSQERQLMIETTPEEMKRGLTRHDWEGELINEWLQLSYDRNNKRGLYGGKLRWTPDELREITRAALTDVQPAFEDIVRLIHQHWEPERPAT